MLVTSLCINCENAPGCLLRNGHAVMHCEEHAVKLMPTKKNTPLHVDNFLQESIALQESLKLFHFEGLCGDCEFKENCTWREPEAITFRCEHYQ